ncbi:MAG: DUF1294 domain-containing protein [Prevotella sp.]|nr:DUF1294 domain-containing protein [Prevotella sp.]
MKHLVIYLFVVNVVAFLTYGWDKWKAQHKKWRISEGNLLWLAAIGGSLGALFAMICFRHKTRHPKFKYGIPLILMLQISLFLLISCKSTKEVVSITPKEQASDIGAFSPTTLIIMYDQGIGKEALLKAVKEYKAEIIYDYHTISGIAIKKPKDKTIEETIELFKAIQGVIAVERDRIIQLTDPVRPQLLEK